LRANTEDAPRSDPGGSALLQPTSATAEKHTGWLRLSPWRWNTNSLPSFAAAELTTYTNVPSGDAAAAQGRSIPGTATQPSAALP
jgi:hypothetical protein